MAKILFPQTVNPVDPFMVPDLPLPAKHLKKLIKSIPWIAYNRHGQRHNHRLITSRSQLITKYRPAQRLCPAGLAPVK